MEGVERMMKDAIETRNAAAESGKGILSVMRDHLQHIYGILTNKEVPPIWDNVAASKTQDGDLDLLDHLLGKGMDYWKRVYGGHMGILHMSLTLYHLVSKRWLANVDLNLSCPVEGLQVPGGGGGDMVVLTEKSQALDYQPAIENQIDWDSKVDLRVVISE